jgi:hypothetical protein
MKATVEPSLEQVAARIAAVVEDKRPATRPTLNSFSAMDDHDHPLLN